MSEQADSAVRRRDKDGHPLSLTQWAVLFEDDDYRTVAEVEIEGTLVRTLWEGLVAEAIGAGRMFLTCIQRDGDWTTAWEGQHPCTLVEAEAAHELVVADVRHRRPA